MKCDSPFYVLPKAAIDKVPVPCGKCPPCKKRRVDSWVFRLMQEYKRSASAYFVTLTYETSYVPISDNGFMTLKKADFQDYMKRLRKLCPDSVLKYYACGEYGGQNNRPHYHAIIFNVPAEGFLFRAWHIDGQPLGGVYIGTVTDDSTAYVMKYIDKSNFNKKHARDDRQPEFSLMSKKLGANYLTDDMIKYHQNDLSRLFVTKPGGHRIALPRYYREKIYTKSQLKQQLPIIQDAVEKQQISKIADVNRRYKNYDARDYETAEKFGRYYAFYNRQKKRNV